MKDNKSLGNRIYSPPVITVITFTPEEHILRISGNVVGLPGAGINEGNADDLGTLIW